MACLYITTIDGTFMGGLDGAQPGIVMEVHPAIGDFYRQEFDVGNAEDFAEVVGLSDAVTVPSDQRAGGPHPGQDQAVAGRWRRSFNLRG